MKALKFILIPVVSITSLFCIILIASFIGDIGTISHPATVILPLITLFTFLTGTIMLTVWSCLWNQNNNRKKLLKISSIITAFSIVVLFISSPINRMIVESDRNKILKRADKAMADIEEKYPEIVEKTPQKESAPEPAYEPVTYSGTGDSVVNIELPDKGYCLYHINGNSASSHFSVQAYDDNDDWDLLVNVTDPYSGTTFSSKNIVLLEIKAVGDWSIEINHISKGKLVEKDITLNGTGDNILIAPEGIGAITAEINGNSASSHFSVTSYTEDGVWDLLVNATEPYSGTVKISKKTRIFEIKAVGDWSITCK